MSHAPDVNGHTVGQRIGYVRVSTVAQTLDQQNDALEAAGAKDVLRHHVRRSG